MSARQIDLRIPRAAWPLVAAIAVSLGGCASRQMPERQGPSPFVLRVHDILATEWTAPEYAEALETLAGMGAEVDGALVALARDPNANTNARANALVLLADRGSPAAIPALRRALLTEEIPRLRAAAVFGLNRLADTSTVASNMIRAAVGDPVRSVRLNALQALDIREVATVRSVIENDPDREVRAVAVQLVALAESRGAPLAPDRRGALRTAGTDRDPAIVFRPARVDSISGYKRGDLRIELPEGRDIPLAAEAEVVRNVVPAFFSPDRSIVVFEADREIRTVNLESREIVVVGTGVAPRPIPFSEEFLFVREVEREESKTGGPTHIAYEVVRAGFAGGEPVPIGGVEVVARPGFFGMYSPVRWMVVGETPVGFVLRADGMTPFLIPGPMFARPD